MSSTTAPPAFRVETSTHSLGLNFPQKVGRYLWLPMLLMALVFLGAGMALGIVRADEIADGGAADTIASLQHVQVGVMFLGFASVFSATSFAIARILGQFRAGGGEVQEAAGRAVRTLKMPGSAKLFLALMTIATVTLVVASILHIVFSVGIDGTPTSLAEAEDRFVVLEGVRRMGIGVFLLAILLGLATIIRVLRFQAVRMRELPDEPPAR